MLVESGSVVVDRVFGQERATTRTAMLQVVVEGCAQRDALPRCSPRLCRIDPAGKGDELRLRGASSFVNADNAVALELDALGSPGDLLDHVECPRAARADANGQRRDNGVVVVRPAASWRKRQSVEAGSGEFEALHGVLRLFQPVCTRQG